MTDTTLILADAYDRMMEQRCCASCRWFNPFDWSGGGGRCQRRSPLCPTMVTFPNHEPSDEEYRGVWPFMSFYDLCGEWERRSDEEALNMAASQERDDACLAYIHTRRRLEDEFAAEERRQRREEP